MLRVRAESSGGRVDDGDAALLAVAAAGPKYSVVDAIPLENGRGLDKGLTKKTATASESLQARTPFAACQTYQKSIYYNHNIAIIIIIIIINNNNNNKIS